jgi:hypothetical protein
VHDSSTTEKPLRLVGDLNWTMEYFFPEKITIGGNEFFRIASSKDFKNLPLTRFKQKNKTVVSEELHDGSTSGRYCLETNSVSSRAEPK